MACVRLDDLARYTDGRAAETGRTDFIDHAALYRRDRVPAAGAAQRNHLRARL